MLLNKAASSLLVRFIILVPHRVVVLTFPKLVVIGVYLPTYINLTDRAAVFAQIGKMVRELPPSMPLVLAGDFNSRPLNQCTEKTLRLASDQFTDFLLAHSLVAANINFPGKGTLLTHKLSTLDYIVVRWRFRSSIRDVSVRAGPFLSDHKMVTAELKTKWKATPRREQKKQPNFGLLRTPPVAKSFIENVHGLQTLSLVRSLAPTPWMKMLTCPLLTHPDFVQRVRAAIDSLERVNPPPTVRPHSVFPSVLSFLCHHRRLITGTAGWMDKLRLSADYIAPFPVGTRRGNSWEDPLVKDLLFLRSIVDDPRDDLILNAIDTVNSSAMDALVSMYAKVLREDPRKAYRFICSAKTSAPSQMPAKDSNDRMSKFREHFLKLYKGVDRPPGQAPHATDRFEEQLRFNDANFTYDELVFSLFRLKDHKAVGIDGIPNEVLKLPELRLHVLNILNAMLRGEVFKEQKETIIVPLPKKGDLSHKRPTGEASASCRILRSCLTPWCTRGSWL